jgi:hypothetical protein
MKYNFFVNKTVKRIELLPDDGLLMGFEENEFFECHTKFSTSVKGYDVKKLTDKKIKTVDYVKDEIITFYFEDVAISFSLLPADWTAPEDVVYKNYKDREKLIIEIIT